MYAYVRFWSICGFANIPESKDLSEKAAIVPHLCKCGGIPRVEPDWEGCLINAMIPVDYRNIGIRGGLAYDVLTIRTRTEEIERVPDQQGVKPGK